MLKQKFCSRILYITGGGGAEFKNIVRRFCAWRDTSYNLLVNYTHEDTEMFKIRVRAYF